ncbi:PBSX family phage terminase large subunit [Bacillus cereus]|uniref:PBSX family phage terminase large subunit n=1 Tax=Bacillus cereus TaxID=1396 RepID=UPI00099540B6|nr:PBSX family phage terminase large subunit [Bacillus cereus]OOZ84981.1 terminase [Bacillus cereus]
MIKKKISEVIPTPFHAVYSARKRDEILKVVCKGGRGSGKSTDLSICLVMDIIQYPISVLCVRKVKDTLRESCYEQIKEAAQILGVEHLFRFKESPMEIIYKPRGNKFIFRGADDPMKIKSIKIANFPISRVWFEELAEFKTRDEVSTIEKSILRKKLPNGMKYKMYYSYNPPKRKQSWVNKEYETQFTSDNTFVHHSTYLDNPYLSDQTIQEAEETKKKKPLIYEWEYLGKPIGSGIVPFDNLAFRRITDDEIKSFDNIRQGIDWGYGVDPVSFGRMHYDKTRRKLYIFGEIYGVKMSNRVLAEKIKANGWDDVWITCDSAEPKSIDELKNEHGIKRTRGAEKGPGSVEYGEKWLDDLEEIIIDPVRCPNTAREFENIDYETDKDGNPKTRLQDKDNHSIDMTRYSMESDMKKSNKARAVKSIY